MNNITKRNRLMDQLKSYGEYFSVCPVEYRLKLTFEMNKLATEIERIKQMGLDQLQRQRPEYMNVFSSKLNTMSGDITLPIEQKNYGKRTE